MYIILYIRTDAFVKMTVAQLRLAVLAHLNVGKGQLPPHDHSKTNQTMDCSPHSFWGDAILLEERSERVGNETRSVVKDGGSRRVIYT